MSIITTCEVVIYFFLLRVEQEQQNQEKEMEETYHEIQNMGKKASKVAD